MKHGGDVSSEMVLCGGASLWPTEQDLIAGYGSDSDSDAPTGQSPAAAPAAAAPLKPVLLQKPIDIAPLVTYDPVPALLHNGVPMVRCCAEKNLLTSVVGRVPFFRMLPLAVEGSSLDRTCDGV